MDESSKKSNVDTERATASSSQTSEKKKKPNLFLRMGEKIGIIEQTKLAPEFAAEIERYNKYTEVLDNLIDGLEGTVQENPRVLYSSIECPKDHDPCEEFASAVRQYQRVFDNGDPGFVFCGYMCECFLNIALRTKEMQANCRKSIRKMRRFVSTELTHLRNDFDKLMQDKDNMDALRHELKQTKTHDEVETIGKQYEESVHNYDVQAEKIDAVLQYRPISRHLHYREIFEFLDTKVEHHLMIVKLCNDYMRNMLKLIPKSEIAVPDPVEPPPEKEKSKEKEKKGKEKKEKKKKPKDKG